MTDIIMIAIEDEKGDRWNINLNYIIGVQLAGGANVQIVFDTLFYVAGETLKTFTLPAGGWQLALTNLLSDFNSNPKVRDHLFVGTTFI